MNYQYPCERLNFNFDNKDNPFNLSRMLSPAEEGLSCRFSSLFSLFYIILEITVLSKITRKVLNLPQICDEIHSPSFKIADIGKAVANQKFYSFQETMINLLRI